MDQSRVSVSEGLNAIGLDYRDEGREMSGLILSLISMYSTYLEGVAPFLFTSYKALSSLHMYT